MSAINLYGIQILLGNPFLSFPSCLGSFESNRIGYLVELQMVQGEKSQDEFGFGIRCKGWSF